MDEHSYFLRQDTKTVVTTQAEYDSCQKGHVPMRIVSYNSAIDHLQKEEAAKRAHLKKKKAAKVARKTRKYNARTR